MKLDQISQKQLLISLGSAVVILASVLVIESYELQNTIELSDKIITQFEPLFFQWMDSQNCNTLNSLEQYTADNLKHHGISAQAWDNQIIKRITEKCGNAQ